MTSEGQSFWERNAARYDRSMRLFGGPLPRAIELAVAAVDGRRRVLEIACGTGLFSEALAPVVGELLSTDYAEAMVGQARAASAALAALSFPGQRRFTLESLCQAVADAGLEVEQAELIPGLLPIGFLVARA